MATRNGYVIKAPVSGVLSPHITEDLELYAFEPFTVYHSAMLNYAGSGPRTATEPVASLSRARDGSDYPSYFEDFYNRIHITPRTLDFGNILSDKELTFTIWNAFLVNRNFTDATVPANSNVSLDFPAGVTIPYNMEPLREFVVTATALLSGPPTLTGDITFVIGGETLLLPISGRRIVVFPFKPNWQFPLDETFEYSGWVLTAADGTEQSGSNWGNQARRQFDFTIMAKGRHVRRLQSMTFGWQHRLFGVPHWVDKSKLTAAVAADDTFLPFDTTNRSFVAGHFGVLYLDEDNYEAFEVQSVAPGSVLTTSPLQRAWPVGTRVYPVSAALINGTLSGLQHTDDLAVMPVSFQCEPSQSPTNNGVGPATPTYRGHELYLGRLNWVNALSFQQESDRSVLDYRTGTFNSYSLKGFGATIRPHNWLLSTRQEGQDFRAWLGRREGVARPVFMPTGKTDLVVVANVTAPSFSLDVQADEYENFVDASRGRRDIIIQMRSGAYYCRRIVDVVPLVGGVNRLTLDTELLVNIDATQIKRVSFLEFYRQVSNSTTIRWVTDSIGTAESSLRTKIAP